MMDTTLSVKELTFLGKGPYSFDLKKGECLGFCVKSGVGKSQLFRAISDLIPSSGNLYLDGIERNLIPVTQWRSRVTLVVTDSCWWFDNVGEHFNNSYLTEILPGQLISLGLPKQISGWQVGRLSTGEKKRLNLLRSLQNQPEVLLLDEPSSGLDAHHTELMESFVKAYQKKHHVSILWVSHDNDQLRRVGERGLRMHENGLSEIVLHRNTSIAEGSAENNE